MRCQNCGVENEEAARFCRSCGSKIETNVDNTSLSEKDSTTISPQQVIPNSKFNKNPLISELKKYWLLLCPFVALLLWNIFGIGPTLIYQGIDAVIWGFIFGSLAISIWKRSKQFIGIWGILYFISDFIFLRYGNMMLKLLFVLCTALSGLAAYIAKRFINGKTSEKMGIAISACVSAVINILVTPLIFAFLWGYGYHLGTPYYIIIELLVSFFSVFAYEKLFEKTN